jgi:hypothetical protein
VRCGTDGGGRDEHGEMLTDAGDGRMRPALAVNAGGMASSPARFCAAAVRAETAGRRAAAARGS